MHILQCGAGNAIAFHFHVQVWAPPQADGMLSALALSAAGAQSSLHVRGDGTMQKSKRMGPLEAGRCAVCCCRAWHRSGKKLNITNMFRMRSWLRSSCPSATASIAIMMMSCASGHVYGNHDWVMLASYMPHQQAIKNFQAYERHHDGGQWQRLAHHLSLS